MGVGCRVQQLHRVVNLFLSPLPSRSLYFFLILPRTSSPPTRCRALQAEETDQRRADGECESPSPAVRFPRGFACPRSGFSDLHSPPGRTGSGAARSSGPGMGFLFCFSFLGLVRPLVSFSIDSSAWVGGLCVFPWIFLFFSFVVCGFFFL